MSSATTPQDYHVVTPGDPQALGWKVPPVNDLRSALELLKTLPGQYLETDHEVDPIAELAGVYRRVGAGGTVERPTRIGPAMMFTTVKGYPDARVLVGMLASRTRVSPTSAWARSSAPTPTTATTSTST